MIQELYLNFYPRNARISMHRRSVGNLFFATETTKHVVILSFCAYYLDECIHIRVIICRGERKNEDKCQQRFQNTPLATPEK